MNNNMYYRKSGFSPISSVRKTRVVYWNCTQTNSFHSTGNAVNFLQTCQVSLDHWISRSDVVISRFKKERARARTVLNKQESAREQNQPAKGPAFFQLTLATLALDPFRQLFVRKFVSTREFVEKSNLSSIFSRINFLSPTWTFCLVLVY